MENQTGITKNSFKSAITVDKIEKNLYSKNTAHLKQTIKTVTSYPGKPVSNDLNASLFNADELGYKPQVFTSTENRIIFQEVPEGITSEQVLAKLAANPETCLYKILSSQPIITPGQKYNIESSANTLTLDKVADSQVVRYPANTVKDGIDVSGQLVLDNGKVQYRRIFLSLNHVDDRDNRTSNPEDTYRTPEMVEELLGASAVSESQKAW